MCVYSLVCGASLASLERSRLVWTGAAIRGFGLKVTHTHAPLQHRWIAGATVQMEERAQSGELLSGLSRSAVVRGTVMDELGPGMAEIPLRFLSFI
eukprot:COSAG01_NODE_10683_length_2105_cov_2.314556_3_plen_96_part_00